MAKDKKKKKAHPKKELRNRIRGKLEAALAEYKSEAGEKTFKAALKKGSKLLSALLGAKKKKAKKEKIKKPEITTIDTSP